jgi:predicted permease
MGIIVDIIMPVFGVVAFGYAATFAKIFDEAAVRGLTVFVFWFALPVTLFRTMATTRLPDLSAIGFLASYYVATAVLLTIGLLVIGRGPLDRRTILGFGAAYSNTVLLGIPLILTALGPTASAPLFLLIAFHSPIYFTLVTVLIEIGRGSGAGLARVPINLVKGLLANVILMAVVGGLVFHTLGLTIPGPLDGAIELLSRAAFPGALFAMGAALRRYRVAGALGPAAAMVAMKLLIHPALVAVLVLYVFQVPPLWAKTAILAAALPTGINVYLFATRYAVAEAESASAILLSNIGSVVTVGVVLALLDHIGP